MGATATGKSKLAIHLAERFGGEIVSMDSRQVYIGMDIGTAKVGSTERRGIPHHLIDVLRPDEPNSAGMHAARAAGICREIASRGNLPILAGGTGLYFRALFTGIIDLEVPKDALARTRKSLEARDTSDLYQELRKRDPERAEMISPNDRIRITRALEVIILTGKPMSKHFAEQERSLSWEGLKLVLTAPRDDLRRRIAKRTREMFDAGWVDEVKKLLDDGYGIDSPGMNSLGYLEIAKAIIAGRDPFSTLEQVITLTRQYAKRQETFFRSETGALWFDVSKKDCYASVETAVEHHLKL